MRTLGVNVDHVATVRQARRAAYPDPVLAAMLAEQAGADQVTCHLRCDRRHIQESDLQRLKASVRTLLNVECAATDEMLGIMEAIRPHRVTLVPERPDEITTEGGLDVLRHRELLERAVGRLVEAGIRVSLFVDPEPPQVEAAVAIPGVDMVELNTARYAEAHDPAAARDELERLARAAEAVGGSVVPAAGHGLHHLNLPALVRAVPSIVEYNIGHAIVAQAIFVGWERAVGQVLDILRRG